MLVMGGEAAVGGADGPAIAGEDDLPERLAMMGSMVMTRPSVRKSEAEGSGQLGTLGFSWMVRPMP
jgi:hypothetical protein